MQVNCRPGANISDSGGIVLRHKLLRLRQNYYCLSEMAMSQPDDNICASVSNIMSNISASGDNISASGVRVCASDDNITACAGIKLCGYYGTYEPP
jgi:hypothetical protein